MSVLEAIVVFTPSLIMIHSFDYNLFSPSLFQLHISDLSVESRNSRVLIMPHNCEHYSWHSH